MADHTRPYGIGLAYRPELHASIMRSRGLIDMLEIPSVDYLVRAWRVLQDPQEHLLHEALETFPSAVHGVQMSVGSVEPHDESYLSSTTNFMAEHGIVSMSEHLAFHRLDGFDLHSFLPMPYTEESLNVLTHKYNAARARMPRPFGLENVSYLVNIPGGEMDEAEFLTELTRRTDCSLLLDVTNVFNNAHNHGYDPVDFIRRLPGERVEHLHIAGGRLVKGTWLDSHSEPVMEGVWGLVEEALTHTAAEAIILEKDVNLQPYGLIRRDMVRARELFYRHRPATPPQTLPHWMTAGEPAGDDGATVYDEERFADLRNFQRALIQIIKDKPYRKAFFADPSKIQADYPMAQPWQDRLAGATREHFDAMASKWQFSEQQAKDRDRDYQQREWQAWSMQ